MDLKFLMTSRSLKSDIWSSSMFLILGGLLISLITGREEGRFLAMVVWIVGIGFKFQLSVVLFPLLMTSSLKCFSHRTACSRCCCTIRLIYKSSPSIEKLWFLHWKMKGGYIFFPCRYFSEISCRTSLSDPFTRHFSWRKTLSNWKQNPRILSAAVLIYRVAWIRSNSYWKCSQV